MTIWVQNIKKTHYEIILSTLLPHPPDFAKVGGHWEKLSSRTEQMKEGTYMYKKSYENHYLLNIC